MQTLIIQVESSDGVSPEVVLGMPFLEETFLVANVSSEVVLEMPFLTLSGADVDFLNRELRWRTYTTEEALPTTRRAELVGKKELQLQSLTRNMRPT